MHTTLATDSNLQNGEVNLGRLTGEPDPDNPGWTIYTISGAGSQQKLINGGDSTRSDEANYVALTRVDPGGANTSLDAYGVLRNGPRELVGGAADGFTTTNLNPGGGGDSVLIDYEGNVTSGPTTPDDAVICFAAGTLIETQAGPVPVEELSRGTLIATRDNGFQPVQWIGCRALSAQELEAAPKLRPIRIGAGSLGQGQPSRDLLVSPQHRVLVRSAIAQRMFGAREVLVAAKQLVGIDGIAIANDLGSVRYYHFMLARHEILISNGAATESLFTGPEALRSVGPGARAELEALFPELLVDDADHPPARLLVPGRRARQFAARHLRNNKPLLS